MFTIETLTTQRDTLKAHIDQLQVAEQASINEENARIQAAIQALNDRVAAINAEQLKRTGRLELLNEQIEALKHAADGDACPTAFSIATLEDAERVHVQNEPVPWHGLPTTHDKIEGGTVLLSNGAQPPKE